MLKFAAIGECLIELTQIDTNQMALGYAGDTYNTAHYIAKNNKSLLVSYVTALGQDSYSNAMLKQFQASNIDTSTCLQFEDLNPGLYLVENDDSGEREFHYYREQSAARQLFNHPNIRELENKLTDYDYLFLSGITLAILDEHGRTKLLNLLKSAKQRGAKILFDNNYRPRLWQTTQQPQAVFEEFHSIVDWLFVTFSDEQELYGDNSVEDTLSRYKTLPLAIIKDGANPCLITSPSGIAKFKPCDVTRVIDTTGAGDAFNAGFLSHYIETQSLREAAEMGHQLAAQVIQHKGAIYL